MRLVKAVNHAVDTFAMESAALRKTFDDLPAKLKAIGQDLLANDVRQTSERLISAVGVETRFNLDIIEAKAKRYLVALRNSIGKAKNKLLLTTDLRTAQEIVAGISRDLDTELAPTVPSFSPAVLQVAWKDHWTPSVEGVQGEHVFFTGYALRPKAAEDLRLLAMDQDGKVRRDATQHLTIHTPYTASVNLATNGLRFTAVDAGDRRLRLVYKGETIGEISLQWGTRPLLPPKLMHIKSILTTTSHKEEAGQVELTFFYGGRRLADSQHAQKRVIAVFPRGVDFVGHIGAYRTWEKGHREEFIPPGGLAFSPDCREVTCPPKTGPPEMVESGEI
jgi:hypothetical protein